MQDVYEHKDKIAKPLEEKNVFKKSFLSKDFFLKKSVNSISGYGALFDYDTLMFREGEGQIFSKLCDRSSLLSIVSHSLSAYITTLDAAPLQRLSNRKLSPLNSFEKSSLKTVLFSLYCKLFS
jgi:hypothetical protein